MALASVLAFAPALAAQEPPPAPVNAQRLIAKSRMFDVRFPAPSPADGKISPGTTASSLPAPQQQTPQPQQRTLIVQRIEIIGNRRIPRDTIKARIFTRDGDVFNEELLHRDFQAMWNTQYFDDIRLEIEESPDKPNAVIVVFYVKERPTIRRIEYCKMPKFAGEPCKKFDAIQESEILERFKERKVGLSVESLFDPTRIKKAEVTLKEMLGERGRQFAVVRPSFERIAATNAVKLTFNIDQGPKVKVGDIQIEGNTVFSDRKIIRSMRHSRPYAVPMWFFDWNVMSKTYDRRKLAEDMEVGIRSLYQDNGYYQVLVREPVVETVDVKSGGLPGPIPLVGRKQGKRTNIKLSIQEGDQFRMGKLFIVSSDVTKPLYFKTDALASVFLMKQGDIFSVDKVRKSLEEYKKVYGAYGFIDFTPEPSSEVNAQEKTIDLTLKIDEQKQFYVRRIDFRGNTTTRDKVIRREILLDEGDLFNNRFWEVSILRINQLDYFEPIKPEHAEIKRNLKEGSVDIILKVKEKGKQSIGLQGGVSGIAGSFIGLTYQTNNLLGRGETLTFSAEFGDRQRNLVFGYTNPYLFDRPISSGFTVFSRRFSYNQSRETSILVGQQVNIDPTLAQNYDQKSKGFTFFSSYPMRRFGFARVGLTYGFTETTIQSFSNASRLLFETVQFRSLAGPSALQGIRSSKITPSINYNTVDHPINPTRGKSFFYAFGLEGGVLQGNVNTMIHTLEFKYFRPVNKKRNVLGLRILAANATGYGGIVLPPFNRFYIGGEDSIRGFDYFTVSPWAYIPTTRVEQVIYFNPQVLDSAGNPIGQSELVPVLDYVATQPGGDTQAVSNIEYRIPIVGPVTMAFFMDFGTNGILRKNQLRMDPTGVRLLRTTFPATQIPDRLTISSGTNFKLRSSAGIEVVVQLPVVNAPFRIYWAYNWMRLTQQIVESRGDYFISETTRARLGQSIIESQFVPRLNALVDSQVGRGTPFEPLKTFRFTVSRTF